MTAAESLQASIAKVNWYWEKYVPHASFLELDEEGERALHAVLEGAKNWVGHLDDIEWDNALRWLYAAYTPSQQIEAGLWWFTIGERAETRDSYRTRILALYHAASELGEVAHL
jgi:hypothetical protein